MKKISLYNKLIVFYFPFLVYTVKYSDVNVVE